MERLPEFNNSWEYYDDFYLMCDTRQTKRIVFDAFGSFLNLKHEPNLVEDDGIPFGDYGKLSGEPKAVGESLSGKEIGVRGLPFAKETPSVTEKCVPLDTKTV